MPFIYKITNTINGKAYVGKTLQTVHQRWREHCRHSCLPHKQHRPLYDAMNKYGIENFIIETLEECMPDVLESREIYWIQHFDTYRNGYNATLGGDGSHYLDYDTVVEVFIRSFDYITQAANYCVECGLAKNKSAGATRIQRACAGKNATAYGYKWEYMIPEEDFS